MSKMRTKFSCLAALIVLAILTAASNQALATSVVATIIPPQPYQVYVGEAYMLTVGVQYSVDPPDQTVFLYVVAESYTSQLVPVSGSGVTTISLQLQAPQIAGTYTLQLNLYVRIPGEQEAIWDSATVPYQVLQPVVTDWDVQKAWVVPESPGVGDQVTFHATIELKSTTSTEPLSVVVAVLLDKNLYYSSPITFQPQPSTQDFDVPQTWTAVKGTHVLTVVVDPQGRHNDPTPYPYSNFKEVQFAVMEYYAVIKSIAAPPEVNQGEQFNVVVTVEYKLPPNTNLMLEHVFWSGTIPPASNQTTDTVSGSGSKDYTFKVTTPAAASCLASQLGGNATVMFDVGKGWQITSPGGWGSYSVNVKSAAYYAKILSISAQPTNPSNPANQSIFVTFELEYFLPKNTGLRVTVYQSFLQAPLSITNYSRVVWKDESYFTQAQEPAKKAVTVTFLSGWACGPRVGCTGNSTTLIFRATLDYLACGGWQSGGEVSTQVTVPNPPSPKLAKTPLDYLIAALQTIVDWFKKLFGQ